MKKIGFTLAELLIALSIIGVVAAISAPSISKIVPDKSKVVVLKMNSVLIRTVSELISDKSLYLNLDCASTSGATGLDCTATPRNPDFASCTGNNKFGCLLSNHLELDSTATNTATNFTTIDGVVWTVTKNTTGYVVKIDINGSAGKGSTYSSTNTNPDQFEFFIDSEGRISGNDKLTKAYLMNPNKLNDKKADLKKASEL